MSMRNLARFSRNNIGYIKIFVTYFEPPLLHHTSSQKSQPPPPLELDDIYGQPL